MKQLLTILITLLPLSGFADLDLQQTFEGIKYIETKNDTLAIGDNGRAWGIVQIHKIAVDDVNRIYGTWYDHEDAFDPVCAQEIFELYLMAGIKRFKKRYGKEPTEQDVVRMWNGGIYHGYKKRATLIYWRKYLLWKKGILI